MCMKTIWKYPLPSYHQNEIQMPKGSYPLSVGLQYGKSEQNRVMWAVVNPNVKQKEDFCIYVTGTGDKFDHLENFLGTLILENGALVQHVFWEVGKCREDAYK